MRDSRARSRKTEFALTTSRSPANEEKPFVVQFPHGIFSAALSRRLCSKTNMPSKTSAKMPTKSKSAKKAAAAQNAIPPPTTDASGTTDSAPLDAAALRRHKQIKQLVRDARRQAGPTNPKKSAEARDAEDTKLKAVEKRLTEERKQLEEKKRRTLQRCKLANEQITEYEKEAGSVEGTRQTLEKLVERLETEYKDAAVSHKETLEAEKLKRIEVTEKVQVGYVGKS